MKKYHFIFLKGDPLSKKIIQTQAFMEGYLHKSIYIPQYTLNFSSFFNAAAL